MIIVHVFRLMTSRSPWLSLQIERVYIVTERKRNLMIKIREHKSAVKEQYHGESRDAREVAFMRVRDVRVSVGYRESAILSAPFGAYGQERVVQDALESIAFE